jgi:hypothetical protein
MEKLLNVKQLVEGTSISYQQATEIVINNLVEKIFLEQEHIKQVEKELNHLIEQLTQQKERFQHNLMYVEVVEDIITCTETEWENKTFNNMLVRLVGKDEVYKIFTSKSNAPVIGNKINFTYNADENKLSKLKIVE